MAFAARNPNIELLLRLTLPFFQTAAHGGEDLRIRLEAHVAGTSASASASLAWALCAMLSLWTRQASSHLVVYRLACVYTLLHVKIK